MVGGMMALVKDSDAVFVEEYARQKIAEESLHIGEIDKMLRKPGDIARAGSLISPQATA